MSADPKPAARIVATRSQWDDLRFEKLGTCRVCGAYDDVELHHLLSKSLRGSDVAANLIPLCHRHHMLAENWDPPTLHAIRSGLRPEELRYLLDHKGVDYLERRYPSEGPAATGPNAEAPSPSRRAESSTHHEHTLSDPSPQSSRPQPSPSPTRGPGHPPERP